MLPGQKHCIKIFGIRILKIKAKSIGNFSVYLFFIPLLSIKISKRKTNINLLVIQKIYEFAKKYCNKIFQKRKIKKSKQKIIKKFQKGEKLKICLMTSRPGMWSYDHLYKILKNDKRFEVVPFVMPDPLQGKKIMLDYINASMQELSKKRLKPTSGWNFDRDSPINLRQEINPDIILYSDFWKPHFMEEFYITAFLDKITLLNEYGYSVMQDELTSAFEMNRLVDMYFRPTEIHKTMAKKYMLNKGQNVVITRSPKIDPFIDENYKIKYDPWKKQNKPKKRIIWAPHHCKVAGSHEYYCCNAFWEIYDDMLRIAEKYKDEIQIAFRPHPMLKPKVAAEWGEEKTNSYWLKWENLENAQFSNGSFIDLFITSDAMIMDCCSFLAEYTATNKPLFYTKTKTSRLILNEFGKMLFNNVYDTGENLISDIENFIQDVVINGNDYKKEQRTQFVQQYFGKINGKTASENIYNEIINFLEKGEV